MLIKKKQLTCHLCNNHGGLLVLRHQSQEFLQAPRVPEVMSQVGLAAGFWGLLAA